jgi:hypothetical protein
VATTTCALNTLTANPFPWRDYLPALDGLPLLPCGAGADHKAPLDPATGGHLSSWQNAAYSPQQIAAMNGIVTCCGTRTGPDANGLLVFDLDGPSAIAYCQQHGCDPTTTATWQIHRNTDPTRLKVCFKLPPDLWHHLPGKRKHTTGNAEQIELFFGSGQIIVIGDHRTSNGFYFWPEGKTAADLTEPPPEWWALALQITNADAPPPPTISPSLPLWHDADDLTRATDAIRHLDPSMGYDDWIQIGMALHAIDPLAGFSVWDRWSAGGNNYQGTKDLEHHWRSFKPSPGGVAAGSLFKAAKGRGWTDPRFSSYTPPYSAPQPAHSAQAGQPGSESGDGPTDDGSNDPDPASARRAPRSELLAAALDAAENGDHDTHAEIQAELMGRFRMTGSQVQAALFRLLSQRRGTQRQLQPGFVDVATVEHLDHLLPGFIAAHEQTLLHAPKGTGKTLAALAIARSIVTGSSLLDQGTTTTPGRVLYLATDSGCASMHTQMQELGLLTMPEFQPGSPSQRFFLRGHDAAQGISAWEATVAEILWLMQAIAKQQLDLVIIDSAKACLSLTDTDYTDNRAVGALLTLFQRVVCPTCAVLWLHHDGRETGHNAGAKAWAEIPVIVHRLERVQEPQEGRGRANGGQGHADDGQRPPAGARKWVCVKSRIPGDERDFHYTLSATGELQVTDDVDIVGNCRDAVLQVLWQAHAAGEHDMAWSDLATQVLGIHGRSPKTVKNTISRMSRGRSPELVRPRAGRYGLSPKLLAELSLRGVNPHWDLRGRDLSDTNGSDPVPTQSQSPDVGTFQKSQPFASGPPLGQPESQSTTGFSASGVPTTTHTPMEPEIKTADDPWLGPLDAPTPAPVGSPEPAGAPDRGNMPIWLPRLIELRQQQPTAAAATLALLLDPNGIGQPTGATVKHWLPVADGLIAEGNA